MSYKPDEQELMAYLYDELEGTERARVEQYLLCNPQVRADLEKLGGISRMLGTIKDKEVIAPPIVLGDSSEPFWKSPYVKTVLSIAASLIIVILVARFADLSLSMNGNEFRLGFGKKATEAVTPQPSLSQNDVQKMINESLQANNNTLHANWEESQVRLEKSIRQNLVMNSGQMNELVKQASMASKDQVQQYVSGLQNENLKMVKDYFTLTSAEQKQYIEGLLVDFAKYLQQEQKNDLQLVEMRLNNLEQNTSVFKEETEQILTSIISGAQTTVPAETKY